MKQYCHQAPTNRLQRLQRDSSVPAVRGAVRAAAAVEMSGPHTGREPLTRPLGTMLVSGIRASALEAEAKPIRCLASARLGAPGAILRGSCPLPRDAARPEARRSRAGGRHQGAAPVGFAQALSARRFAAAGASQTASDGLAASLDEATTHRLERWDSVRSSAPSWPQWPARAADGVSSPTPLGRMRNRIPASALLGARDRAAFPSDRHTVVLRRQDTRADKPQRVRALREAYRQRQGAIAPPTLARTRRSSHLRDALVWLWVVALAVCTAMLTYLITTAWLSEAAPASAPAALKASAGEDREDRDGPR